MDCFSFGSGDRTMVIIPGLSVQSVMGFADLVKEEYRELTDTHTIYVFDRRKDLPKRYSVEEMARDTACVLKALGLGDVDLFGASQGGMIAMEIAIEHPELVHKLALGSTSSCVEEDRFETIQNWIDLAENKDREGLCLAFGEAVYPEEVFEQSRQLLTDAAETVTDEELERFTVLAKGMKGFDITDDLGKISCPVLVIGSKDDKVLGGDASQVISDSLSEMAEHDLYMYDGYGHAAYDTAPDYRDRLLGFFIS